MEEEPQKPAPPIPETTVVCALSKAKMDLCRRMGIVVPPGALDVLINRMKNVVILMTEKADDVNIGSVQKTQGLPAAVPPEDGEFETYAFSRFVDNVRVFSKKPRVVAHFPQLHTVYKRITFDEKTYDLMKDRDCHIVVSSDANIKAIILMPPGWTDATARNLVCHRCGKFPCGVRCHLCMVSVFCSELCLLFARETEVHSDAVCEQFIRAREGRMYATPAAAAAAAAEAAAATAAEEVATTTTTTTTTEMEASESPINDS